MPRPGGRGFEISGSRQGYGTARRGMKSNGDAIRGLHVSGMSVVLGLKELEKALDGLNETVQKRIMRSAVNRGLTIIAREIRKSVPPAITPGHNMNRRVKKSVGIRPYRARIDHYAGKTGLRVGNRIIEKGVGARSSTTTNNIAPHAHWVPLGTKDRYTKTGAYRGRVKPRGFVPQADARARPKMLSEMRTKFIKDVTKEFEKQKAKHRPQL